MTVTYQWKQKAFVNTSLNAAVERDDERGHAVFSCVDSVIDVVAAEVK